jgi:hypothetical protein
MSVNQSFWFSSFSAVLHWFSSSCDPKSDSLSLFLYLDAMAVNPEDAVKVMIAADLKPLEPFQTSKTKWKCVHIPCKTIVYVQYKNIRAGQGGCYECGRKSSAVKRTLSSLEAVKIMRKAGLEPLEDYVSTKTPWRSKCIICGTIVKPRLGGIQSGQGGCTKCGKASMGEKQRLDAKDAEELMIKANLIPLEPYENSKKKWKVKCGTCGSLVSPKYEQIRDGGGGCRKCGNERISRSLTILESEAIRLMKEAGASPVEPYYRAKSPWKCYCDICGNSITPTLSSVISGHTACGICAERQPNFARINKVMEKRNLKPLEPYKNALTAWKCLCLTCNNIVYPRFNNVSMNNGGCGFCATKGLILSKESYLYLITNPGLGAHKVGIGNKQNEKKNDRIYGRRGFVSQGWEVCRIWNFENGAIATKLETEVFRKLRKEMGIPVFLSKEDVKVTGGHSETVDAESISLPQLQREIANAIRRLGIDLL